ncbi:hypothetical protein QOZ80_1BG0057050 [Eleusine coracana subsp. coracana]|nr:hypothetical protein QOZ80_1BG0057050 [Eleusine coracana subsp. coracana]
MSCNGCRVLRKGCSDDCAIRPCLQWIRSPDAQGNATVFLAKFYGRAGLINLISAGPENVQPAIFRSLLYEACGRMLNPVYGSVGLLWSGNWQLCQATVENVLRGVPIAQPPPAATPASVPPLKTCDIRHVDRRGSGDIHAHGVANSSHGQFKRRGGGAPRFARRDTAAIELVFSQPSSGTVVDARHALPLNWAPAGKPWPVISQEYSPVSHDDASPGTDSNTSVDTVEVSHVSQSYYEPEAPRETDDGLCEVGLDLALGLLPMAAHKIETSDLDDVQHYNIGEPLKIGLGITPSGAR